MNKVLPGTEKFEFDLEKFADQMLGEELEILSSFLNFDLKANPRTIDYDDIIERADELSQDELFTWWQKIM